MFAPLCKPNASHNICRIAFACFCSKAWSSKVWEAILGSNSGKQFWAAILGSNLGSNSGSLCTSERVSGEANFGLTLKTIHKQREAIWEAIWEAKWSTTFWAVDTSLIHRMEVRTPYATHVWGNTKTRKNAKWLPPEAARASSECCRRQTSACQRDLTIDQTMTAQHLRQQHLRHTRFVRGQAGCASGLQAVSRLGSCKAPAPRSATPNSGQHQEDDLRLRLAALANTLGENSPHNRQCV